MKACAATYTRASCFGTRQKRGSVLGHDDSSSSKYSSLVVVVSLMYKIVQTMTPRINDREQRVPQPKWKYHLGVRGEHVAYG